MGMGSFCLGQCSLVLFSKKIEKEEGPDVCQEVGCCLTVCAEKIRSRSTRREAQCPQQLFSPTCPEKSFRCLLKDSVFPDKRYKS